MARYERFFSPAEESLLCRGGTFNFLISDHINGTSSDPDAFDIHLRENNEIMYYHGTTCILIASLSGQTVRFSADKRYEENRHAGNLFQVWPLKNADELRAMLKSYFAGICNDVNPKFYDNHKEGYWQNRLCIHYGQRWDNSKEWLIIDRESVLGFATKHQKNEFYSTKKTRYQNIKANLQQNDPIRWGIPNVKRFGDELDMLAISPSKELVAIELKHGSSAAGVYWAPLQVSVYRDAFSDVLPEIAKGLIKLVHQKVAFGLLPKGALAMLPDGNFSKVQATVAVGDPNEASTCWGKMREVLEAMRQAGLPTDINLAKFTLGNNGMQGQFGHI